MRLEDLFDSIGHKKRKIERVESAQESAIGMRIVAAASAALGIICTSKSGEEPIKFMKEESVSIVETEKETAPDITEAVNDSAKQEIN